MRTFGTASLLLVLAACGTNTVGPSPSNPSQANPPDTSSPTVSITSPTSTGAYSTASAAVALAGSASDNVGVVSVSWRNAANAASGGATGTSSWTIPSVALVSGVNTITVSARDAAGNTGGSTLAVTYSPGGTVSLSGNVDSSLVNLNRSGANTVYLYNGTVTPSGAVQPAATTLVTQDNGACTFSYKFGTLPAGSYTVALSSDGATFVGTSTVTLPGTHDFPANRRLQVGATRTLKVPSAAAAVALNGDAIEIDAGDYPDDNVVWTQNNLTLRGVGGRAHMRSTTLIGNGKGIWVTDGQNTTVENIEFSGASVTDQNGAGIRTEGPNLTVCNGYFHDNENGILGGGGVVLIEYSEFDHNGFGDGFTHNMYISDTSLFTLQYSYSHRAHIGHNVKSRSQETRILYNRIMDEADGDGSYAIDIPQVGRTFIIGNLIQQGPLTDNSTIIAYGAESALNVTQELYVVNNTIVNDLHSGAFFSIRAGTTARMVNNIFSGGGSLQTGSGITYATSLVSPPLTTPPAGVTNAASAGLVNSAAYDYHLTSTSPAINAGSDPGSVGAVSLVPTSQYVDPINRQDRPSDGSIDIGAYEFQ
jgi:hypothetical protein